MAKYTTQLRSIVENYTWDNYTLSNNERIEIARTHVFNFDYPIWANEYRKTLETKIIKHFYTKEIGFETLSLWQFYLEERLNLIMPYYNQLYASTIKDYDYLKDIDYTESNTNTHSSEAIGTTTGDGTQHNAGTVNTTTTDTNTSKNLKSDLPQANYNSLDYGTGLEELDATLNSNVHNSNDNTATTTTHGSTNNNISSTDNTTITKKGNTGTRSFTQLINEYRDSLLNIDNMIINELRDLFMMIY